MDSKEEIITIEKVVNTGAGLGRLSNGKVIFVPFTLPSEKIKVKITGGKKDFAFGKVIDIITPSPKRSGFHCTVFTKCGGCNYGHTNYDYEIELKKAILFEILEKDTKITKEFILNELPFSILKSKNRFGYRNNAILKVDHKGNLGFFESKSLKIIPFNEFCKLLPEEMNKYLSQIEKDIFLFTKGFRIRLGDKIYQKGIPTLKNDKFAFYDVNEFKYRVDIDGFFQVNRFNNNTFQKDVVEFIDEGIDSFVELYAGVGFFTLPIIKNKNIKNIYACELSKNAVNNAIYNIYSNLGDNSSTEINSFKTYDIFNEKIKSNIKNSFNTTFEAMDSEEFISSIDNIDTLLVDPPRAGLTNNIIKNIISKKIRKIIYVSCNPSTFARDIKSLIENNYKLKYLKMIDNFPLTYHIEVIGVLELK